MASKLLVAALCVPLHENRKASSQYYDIEVDRDRGLRLSSLLGLTTSLDCKVLLQDLVARGVPDAVAPEVAELHTLLQTDQDPLELCAAAGPVLAKLQETYPQYLSAIKKTICVLLLGQLSEVYQAMQMSSLEKLTAGIVSMQEMEKLIVEAVRHNHVQVRLDFQTRTLHFGNDGVGYDDIRFQLNQLNKNLKEAIHLVQPELKQKQEASVKRELQMLADELPSEHERILSRKDEIENRKEDYEKELQRKEQIEKEERRLKEEEDAKKERARLDKEAERREAVCPYVGLAFEQLLMTTISHALLK